MSELAQNLLDTVHQYEQELENLRDENNRLKHMAANGSSQDIVDNIMSAYQQSIRDIFEKMYADKMAEVNQKAVELETLVNKTNKHRHELQLIEEAMNGERASIQKARDDLQKEVDNERKVSFVKGIEAQLEQEKSRNMILQRQVEHYKAEIDALKEASVNSQPVRVEDDAQSEVEDSVEAQPERLEDTDEEVEEHIDENVAETDEDVEKTLPGAPIPGDEDEIDPEEEEGVEVVDFEHKGVMYYLDPETGDIYARLEDDEVGDIIGKKAKNGRVKFGVTK